MVRAAALLGLLAVLTACGAPGSTASTTTSTTASTTAAPAARTVIAIDASSVTATARGLTLAVELPAGAPGCGSDPTATVTAQDRRTVWVATTATATLGPACDETERRTASVEVSLRGRRLVVNDERWRPSRGATYVRCGPRGCDPPTDRCDPAWTQSLGATADLPTERHLEVLACRPPWLVADLGTALSGCVPLEGASAPPGCRNESRRWFARLTGGTWQVVAAGTGAGCAEVLVQVPDFPRRLCRDLLPVP